MGISSTWGVSRLRSHLNLVNRVSWAWPCVGGYKEAAVSTSERKQASWDSVARACATDKTLTGCLHVPIVGPTGRSDPGYVRLSVRPVGQTGRTDCSRTTHICQSNQCGLLANYNTAYAAAWLVVRLASRTDQSDVVSTRFDSRIGSRTKSNIRPSARPVGRSVLHDTIVWPTSRTDQSDRPVGPTIVSCKRPVTLSVELCSHRRYTRCTWWWWW